MTRAPGIIAIAGPSCSGKTTLSRALLKVIDNASCLGLDSYYRDQRGVSDHDINVDVPDAIDVDLLATHVRALARGNVVDVPVYDYRTHARTPESRTVQPGRVVILEGLFALYWENVREVLSGAIFVDADDAVCRSRRVARDIRERGRSEASIIHQYENKVRPMYERYVAPTRRYADLVLNGNDPVDVLVGRVRAEMSRWLS